jgi:glycosyltransferase involved in cell wall biosynthesis
MLIKIWSGLGRIGSYATGVGKHAMQVSTGIAARPGWQASLLLSSDLWKDQGRSGPSAMDALPSLRLPLPRRALELCWRTLGTPTIDRWLDGADWLYCPKELYVPVRQARYAVTVHDVYRLEPEFRHLHRGSQWRWRWILARALREADLVLAVSGFTRDRLVDLLGVSAEKIRVIGNGVDDGFFDMAQENPSAVSPFPNQPYVLAVGGVTHKKGGPALLAVAEALSRTAPGLRLVVTGPVAPEYAAAVQAADNILPLARGFPNSEMQRLVRGASVALLLSEYEGFGIPALEAMAAGVPVVAARRASLPEVIGDAGVLVEPTRPSSVAAIIADLQADSTDRAALMFLGQKRAAEFRWSACVDRVCAALEEFGSGVSPLPASAERVTRTVAGGPAGPLLEP